MKPLIYNSILALSILLSSTIRAQNTPDEHLGLPGDNLNLYAVMNLFQESETLESFERSLNDPEKMINNLDLNGDNTVDYIMVFDYQEKNIHNIVLRVALNQNENQDVAVIIVEKFNDGSARVQLIGDEVLYGPNYIVEPNYAETPNPGYQGKSYQSSSDVVTVTYYEVAYWPVIEYIYEPAYVIWSSPWFWGCYLPYWQPWSPYYWHYYYGYHHNWHGHYHAHYRHWRYHRCDCYHDVYHSHIRNHSNIVVQNIRSGNYLTTYSQPDKRIDGERLFAQKHPEGIKEPLGKRLSNSITEKPSNQTKPKEVNLTARPDNSSIQNYKIENPRPLKDDSKPAQALDNKEVTEPVRINKNGYLQKKPESVKPESSKPQAIENRDNLENFTTKPIRHQPSEPVRQPERTSSSQDRPSRQSSNVENRNSSESSRSSESRSSESLHKSSSTSNSSSSNSNSSSSNDSKKEEPKKRR